MPSSLSTTCTLSARDALGSEVETRTCMEIYQDPMPRVFPCGGVDGTVAWSEPADTVLKQTMAPTWLEAASSQSKARGWSPKMS